jgi:putative phosphoesterase
VLGVVSNSDGRAESVSAALEVFAASGVEFVLHCGDVGGRHVLDALALVDSAFVWGDRDRDRMGLLRYAQSIGVGCFGMLGELQIGEKKLVIVHGDERKIVKKLIDEQQYDYVLCGHDSWAEDRTVGRTRVINPGALYGASAKSAVVLEPQSGKMRLLAL